MLNSRESPEWGMPADDEPACALYRQRCRDACAKRSHATVEVYRPTTSSPCSADVTDAATTPSPSSRAQKEAPQTRGFRSSQPCSYSTRDRHCLFLLRRALEPLAHHLAQ